MNEQQIKDELQSILDTIVPGASLEELEPDDEIRETLDIDSFDFLRVIQKLEERLKVSIPESDYPMLATLGALLKYLTVRTLG